MARAKPPVSPKAIQQTRSVVAARRIAPIARPILEETTSSEPMKAANVVSIEEYRNQETISTLEQLLARARAGEVIGLAYAVCLNAWDSGVGATGAYRARPAAGLGALGRLFDVLTK